ncbi:MAG: hypothetical protein U5K29_07220 [Acidimicrobiales bacterium]|nr:hypothetical protein [Acidimicrobiales bacterium]
MSVETRAPSRLIRAAALTGALTLLLAACGDEDDGASAAPPDTTAPDTAAAPDTLEVVAVDFEFENLPERVPAGTQLTFVNNAPTELHELVAVLLPEDEDRSVDELVGLPPEEMGRSLFAVEPVTVLMAAPGGEQIAAVGDGTLSEPGRYAILCVIPTGVEPEVYFAAAAETEEGPPQVEGGPPHIAHGMYAELIVE